MMRVRKRGWVFLGCFLALLLDPHLSRAEGDVAGALSRAASQGIFQMAGADASLSQSSQVWRLRFALPQGAAAGIWAKYDKAAGIPAQAHSLRYAYHISEGTPLPLRVNWEIKGSGPGQTIPQVLRARQGSGELRLDPRLIGLWNEAVLVVAHPGGTTPLTGELAIKAQLVSWSLWHLALETPLGRWLALLVTALLAAALTRLVFRPRPAGGGMNGWRHDLIFGVAGVFGATALLAILATGNTGPGHFPLTPMTAALMGAVMAALLNRIWAGRWPTPVESFRHVVIPGLLMMAAVDMPIWTAVPRWEGLIQMTRLSAAVFWVLYHVANIRRLRTTQHPLDAVMGMRLVSIPFLFGLLLLLPNRELMLQAGSLVCPGSWGGAELRIVAGRMSVLIGFNLLAATACGGANGKGWGPRLWDAASARLLAVVAMAVTVSPIMANMGSGLYDLPLVMQPFATLAATMLSQGLLWAEAYLLTGMLLDAMHRRSLQSKALAGYARKGLVNGMVFGGWFMGLLLLGQLLAAAPFWLKAYAAAPLLAWAGLGALTFPLVKTIIESFEGSPSFLRRLCRNYCRPALTLRGALAGLFIAWAWSHDFVNWSLPARSGLGFLAGVIIYAGMSLASDGARAVIRRGCMAGWRMYGVEALLGGLVGAALGFYFDAVQTPVVANKLALYYGYGLNSTPYDVYPLLSRWGFLSLGEYTGGARLLWNEALAGVISWGVAAWLFAINRSFLMALFQREWAPVKRMASRQGLAELADGTIFVLRWGLWMAPIIFTFLRQMSVPTWYNQDGAIRTLLCVAQSGLQDRASFEAWSLNVFMWVLAYDAFRILIWLDHMGLRVATLVNLSFLGMDRLDERLARFLGPHAAARFIPEGIKRFTTWGPLLIPFYIPGGAAWDQVWDQSKALQLAAVPWIERIWGQSLHSGLVAVGVVFAGLAMLSFTLRILRARGEIPPHIPDLDNPSYSLSMHPGGALRSVFLPQGFDVHRRSYEGRDPAGRAMFIVEEAATPGSSRQVWPVFGNYPAEVGPRPEVFDEGDDLRFRHRQHDLETEMLVTLPDETLPLEAWEVTVRNYRAEARSVCLVPYLEWSLNSADADRGHTQYNRLFPDVAYLPELNAVVALHHTSKLAGFLAADRAPEGINVARVEFIGRAGTLWAPEALHGMHWRRPEALAPCPMFDSIASLCLRVELPPRGAVKLHLWVGCAMSREAVESMIKNCRKTVPSNPDQVGKVFARAAKPEPADRLLIGHGRPPGPASQPYTRFEANGRLMRVLTPFTPRPFDHTMANALGHVLAVTNRGLHSSSSINSQQNRLTPDWADTTGRELPGEAIYLYDRDQKRWVSPVYEPLRERGAQYETDFSTDGTAVFHMRMGSLSSELTVFVPPDEPLGVYRLTLRNEGDQPRRFYCAPYFQITLAAQPEHSGTLMRQPATAGHGWLFENPRNIFRSGPAFVAVSPAPEASTTRRGEFFGAGRTVAHPAWVEGKASSRREHDHQAVAAFRIPVELPPHSSCGIVVVLGQTATVLEAETLIARYTQPGHAVAQLAATRRWWNGFMGTLEVGTGRPEVDSYLYWLRYQALAERIWARKGFYQASGAFGFRDQLQDCVNLIWVEPALARRQILLHAAHQFVEGDTVHWFFLQQDGRTSFSSRSHASDNLLWLAWAVAEYVRMTGDETLLDETVPYLDAEVPLQPLPEGKQGIGFFPLRSTREDSVLKHVRRALDLVLKKRMGKHGLPLMGTGDWNDGLDEIGSEGRGESVWLAFFLYYILRELMPLMERRCRPRRAAYYRRSMEALGRAINTTWRDDRYLRAIHDDGTEIGIKGSGIWEVDALTAAWAVFAGVDKARARTVFDTALRTLERDTVVLLGWPALNEQTHPYLGRSCRYPEGVRENGMYCHGVQWLVGAARKLADELAAAGDEAAARHYRETAERLWRKISPLDHTTPDQIERYGGQPNKQAADFLTTDEPGRMIWNGYTGAAGWMLRQALEGVIGAKLEGNQVKLPATTGITVTRNLTGSPL